MSRHTSFKKKKKSLFFKWQVINSAVTGYFPLPSPASSYRPPHASCAHVCWPALMWTLLSCCCRRAMAAFQTLLQLFLVSCCTAAAAAHPQRHLLPPCTVVSTGAACLEAFWLNEYWVLMWVWVCYFHGGSEDGWFVFQAFDLIWGRLTPAAVRASVFGRRDMNWLLWEKI